MRALMARARGRKGGFLGSNWKTQLLLLMVLLIRTRSTSSVESSAAEASEKSEMGLKVVTHTSGETRQKRAGKHDIAKIILDKFTTIMVGRGYAMTCEKSKIGFVNYIILYF